MEFNKNLKNLEPHYNSQTDHKIKRLHFNEKGSTIFSTEILFKNIEEDLNFYPELKYDKLENIASKHYNVDKTEIIPVNGSDEGIDLCVRTYCNEGDVIVIPNPTFGSYSQCANCFGCKIEKINLQTDKKKWFLDIDNLINTSKVKCAKLIFLSNPLAQVGTLISLDDIEKILINLPNTMLVVDEAYIELVEEKNSAISLFKKYKNITILRTLSKFYGLAGIRLGFIISHYKDDIFKVKMPDNLNKISCQIGINVFENINTDIINNRKNDFFEKKTKMLNWLQQFNEIDTIYESSTHFVYIKLKCKNTDFYNKLLNEFGIKIRIFGKEFENYCRISAL